MKTKIVYGKSVVVDADTIIPSGALYIEDDTIVKTGTYAEITRTYRADETIGSVDSLVIPGLVNAHGHGKGITDFQRGALDDTLETWKFRMYPPVDLALDTLWTAIQLLESGVTTTMHNHNLADPDNPEAECAAAIGAYRKGGLRLAFAPTLANRNLFVYGDNEAFVRSLPPELRQLCEQMILRSGKFGEREYFRVVEDLKARYRSTHTEILHGPLSPQWVSAEALREIKRHADSEGLRIHIHTQQTQLQRLYGFKTHGKSLVAFLYDLGFLGQNVTCGHCVWLSDSDIALLAETGTSVTHHASCNLRVRNGIAPIFRLLERGVTVGIGMDDKEFSDRKDFIEEMRMVSKLHRLTSHRLGSPHLTPRDCFRMGTEYGAGVLGFADRIGSLHPGKKADIVLIDLQRMCEPFSAPQHDVIDLLIYRGRGLDVDTVLVDGEVLLKNRQLTRLDRREVIRELKETIPKDYEVAFKTGNRLFPALRERIAAFFEPWYKELDPLEKDPFYHMNNRN